MRPVIRFLATFGYCGLSPIAPGTVGSLAAAALYLLLPRLSSALFTVVLAALFVLGVWSSGQMERWYGHDAQVIVIDEVVGLLVAVSYLERSAAVVLAGLILFRVFDIVKPFPVGWSQKWPGGWGVVGDDVLAGVYANLCLRGALLLINPRPIGAGGDALQWVWR